MNRTPFREPVPEGALHRDFRTRGGCLEVMNCRAPELLAEGPAGTGKTRSILEKLHRLCIDHPGLRVLLVRKTLKTLATSALATFAEEVLTPQDPCSWYGGSEAEPASYRYANTSRIVIGGMDNADKILSSFYDIVYVNEATELTEDDWESLTARLRHGSIASMRIIGDCNPSFDKHWLLKRCQRGQCVRIKTHLTDNPAYYTDDGVLTPLGQTYIDKLKALSGTRYQRLYLGEWVGMENAVYPQVEPTRQLISLPERIAWTTGAIGIDYGRVHLSAVVAVQQDSTGLYWVRNVWAETGGDPQRIEDAARGMKVRYGLRRGQVDPIQEFMGQRLGFTVAKGLRRTRISHVTRLLDADSLRFDKDGPGVADLVDEMLAYRWETRETDTAIEVVPVRKDDDRVAALEYAIAELALGFVDYTEATARAVYKSDPRPYPIHAGRVKEARGGAA